MFRFFIINIVLMLCDTLFCQSTNERFLSYKNIISDYQKIDTIEKIGDELYNKIIWGLPFWGLYKESISLFNNVYPDSYKYSQKIIEGVNFSEYTDLDALAYIEHKSSDEKCVMINEAHHMSIHRFFTTQVLEKLYRYGYNYLACEGLDMNDVSLNNRGFPLRTSGYYISDPIYANMIKKAIELGYKIVAYDGYDGGGGMEGREKFQAKNIAAIFEKDPSAKVLVHAGLGHIREDSVAVKAMAFWFKKYSGIDPLTINQYSMSPQSEITFEHEKYSLISDIIKVPSVFVSTLSDTLVIDKRMDITVFHPKVKYDFNGVPSWLSNSKYYHRIEFDIKERTSKKILFFDLIKEEELEYPNLVPIYTKAFKEGINNIIDVYSPFKGNHIIKLYYEDGNISTYNIKI